MRSEEVEILRGFQSLQQSASIGQLAAALSKFQAQVPDIPKSKTARVFSRRTNSEFTYRYADLPDILAATRPGLAAHGLAVSMLPCPAPEGCVALSVKLLHESDQWLSGFGTMPHGEGAQAVGSAYTYLRRYLYCAVLGIAADEDDDGAAAHHTHGQARTAAAAPGRAAGENGHRAESGAGNGQSRESMSGKPPTTGRQLFAWMKDQEKRHGEGLVKYVNAWAKERGVTARTVDWDEDMAREAYQVALDAIEQKAGGGAATLPKQAPAQTQAPAAGAKPANGKQLARWLMNQPDVGRSKALDYVLSAARDNGHNLDMVDWNKSWVDWAVELIEGQGDEPDTDPGDDEDIPF